MNLIFNYLQDLWNKPRFFSYQLGGYTSDYALKKGDYVIDAGAYKGWFTMYAADKVGKSGKVFAFEPVKEYAKMIKKEANRRGFDNIWIFNYALSDKKAIRTLKLSSWSSHIINIEQKWQKRKNLREIETIDLDTFLGAKKIQKINFIKMDIEGEEINALKGMKKTISKFKPHMAIASYHLIGKEKSCKLIPKILIKAGYHCKTRNPAHLTTQCHPI